MTSDDQYPDLNNPAPPDLAALESHPSLLSLRGRGSLLDQLPTASTGWAFMGALLASFVAFGVAGAAVVVAWTIVTVAVAALQLITRDLRLARLSLHLARYGLLAILTGVVVLAATAGGSSSSGAPASSPGPSTGQIRPVPAAQSNIFVP